MNKKSVFTGIISGLFAIASVVMGISAVASSKSIGEEDSYTDVEVSEDDIDENDVNDDDIEE